MSERDGGVQRMLTGLLDVVGVTALDDLADTVAEHAKNAGFAEVRLYVGDVERRGLHLLPGGSTPASVPEVLPIEGTLPGRAYQSGNVLPDYAPSPLGFGYWVPMFDGLDRVGLMRMTSTESGAGAREDARHLAALVALAIVSKRGHSDGYARANRTSPMNVAAEAQWQLMPPRTYRDSRVVIAATLEPSYQISGDAYDYAIDGALVHLSIFDAMGHDTAAGQVAALALAAARSARHRGAGIAEAGLAIDRELVGQFDGERFATAALASLDTRSGVLSWANFGHHPVLLLRGGEGIRLPCRPAFPLGIGLGAPAATVCHARLEPGDRVALYTDGIIEARRPDACQYGLARLIDSLAQHHAYGVSVPETVRRFVHSFVDHHDGFLEDDATVLLCEWPGPHA
ncbi:PP2C family protein-serine/threonine phosphatase [Streptomyces odontomachi]|uniref:PP2C family protein-serine/threonine phosphatase n=1 Tax=Streptomyces odontomachi TaxID=2944940 RepID=UPI002109ABDE|nr:PP2C family protein-serine/threonine phosphatase [Streptomyces sp. ODS25]